MAWFPEVALDTNSSQKNANKLPCHKKGLVSLVEKVDYYAQQATRMILLSTSNTKKNIARISIHNNHTDLPTLNKQHEIMTFCNGYKHERVLSGVNTTVNSHKQR
jgi:hypothetical protein